MSNLSLARIMFGSGEEVRRIAGSGMSAGASSSAPNALVTAEAAQAAPSRSIHADFVRRIWQYLSAKP